MRRKKEKNLPRILFAAPSSGSGKTAVTCGFLEILRRRNLACVSFKCGPDYIDPMFHQYVLGIPAYNLDSFFLSPEQVKQRLMQKTSLVQKTDIAVIEGVMGYYDGIGGVSTQASTYEIARLTDTPVVLVIDGKKSSLSLAAMVKGFLTYAVDSHICGVIFNQTSPLMAKRLKGALEELGVRIYGAIPVCEEANWENRHLGLTLPREQEKLREKVDAWADRLEGCLDIEGLLTLAHTAPPITQDKDGSSVKMRQNRENAQVEIQPQNDEGGQVRKQQLNDEGEQVRKQQLNDEGEQVRKQQLNDEDNQVNIPPQSEKSRKTISPAKIIRRIAVARDEAFCFYYQDNLDLLVRAGWELFFFSPLHDHHLPCSGISAILFGGGYPEVYAKALSKNRAMLEEIQIASRHGIKFLAECGGFLYLHEWLEGTDKVSYPMAGLIKANGFCTDKLSRFGYITLFDTQKRQMFRGHEFHYWDSTLPGQDWKAVKPLSTRQWDCMMVTQNMLAGFPHLYYGSNPEWILTFLSGNS